TVPSLVKKEMRFLARSASLPRSARRPSLAYGSLRVSSPLGGCASKSWSLKLILPNAIYQS
ncbi:hypothetical protein OAK47_02705, partial [Planctomycetaceae bacterium]|nr:hypothetical protein [Planctomycetaceae bacterium]